MPSYILHVGLYAAGCADGASTLKDGFNKLPEVQTCNFCVCTDETGCISWAVIGLHLDGARVWIKKRRKPSPMCVPVADIHQAAIFRGNAGLECLGDVGKIRVRMRAVWDFYSAGSNVKSQNLRPLKWTTRVLIQPIIRQSLQTLSSWSSTEPSSRYVRSLRALKEVLPL